MEKRSWGSTVLGGVVALAAGLFFLFSPVGTLKTLVTIFGIFALVAGLLTLVGGLRTKDKKERTTQMVEGGLGIIAGLLLLLRPGVSAVILLWVVGLWAVVVGLTELVHGYLAWKKNPSAWVLSAAGGFTAVFGLALILGRSASMLAISWLVGVYLVAWGCVRVAYGASERAPAGGQRQAA